jgi:hypothetical protein
MRELGVVGRVDYGPVDGGGHGAWRSSVREIEILGGDVVEE